MILQLIWYLVICACVVFYTILDGFDLGVGCVHLFVKKDEDRRVFLNAIGPIWDGNEVWLIIIFGGLFAGFPVVYATICSAFYNLIMILLFGIILRAVAIEFRSKHPSLRWRSFWDGCFCIASLIIAFGIGVILANLVEGIALDKDYNFVGSFSDFFSFYTLLIGVTAVVLFAMHGVIFILMKTEGKLHDKMRRVANSAVLAFVLCYVVASFATFILHPHMIQPFKDRPLLSLVPVLAMLSIGMIPRMIHDKKDGFAFIFSSLSILLLFVLFGIGTFPNFVRSIPPEHTLTYLNSSASEMTLKIILIVAGVGVPLVIGYGFLIYRIFRGKVKVDTHSY